MTLLAAEALDLGHGQARDPELGDGVAYVLELVWLDDGDDVLHAVPSPGAELAALLLNGFVMTTCSLPRVGAIEPK
jgi:hypothetical protein